MGLWEDFVNWAVGAIGSAIRDVKAAIEWALDWVSEGIKTFVGKLSYTINNTVLNWRDGLAQTIVGVTEFISAGISNVTDWLKEAFSSLADFTLWLAAQIHSVMAGTVAALWDGITGAIDTVKNWVISTYQAAINLGIAAWNAICQIPSLIFQGLQAIANWIRDLFMGFIVWFMEALIGMIFQYLCAGLDAFNSQMDTKIKQEERR